MQHENAFYFKNENIEHVGGPFEHHHTSINKIGMHVGVSIIKSMLTIALFNIKNIFRYRHHLYFKLIGVSF